MKKSSLLKQWKDRRKTEASPKAISKAPEGVPIPLSYSQQRLWFLQQLYPANAFYNYSEKYRFLGDLQVDYLLHALELVFRNHDILRTFYMLEDGKPYMRIATETGISVARHDLRSSNATIDTDVQQILDADANHNFDLSQPPEALVSVIRTKEKEHLVMLTLHHIATDKWSMNLLRSEWAAYYRALSNGSTPEPERPEVQYPDFAYGQRNRPIKQEQIDFWKEKLSGDIPMIDLPTDYPRPRETNFVGRSSEIRYFSEETSEAILRNCKQLGVTPYVFFLSVYYLFLYRYTGKNDILIGSPISNRDQKSLENTVGFFNDTIVLRTEIPSKRSFVDLVGAVKKSTLEAFSNKDVPFDLLVRELKPERSLSINPFFQVMFLYYSVSESASFGEDLEVDYEFYNPGVSKFDLTFDVAEERGKLSFAFEYSTELFRPKTIARFQDHIALLVEGVVAAPESPVSQIKMITSYERGFLLPAKSGRTGAFEEFTGIHQCIERMAATRPDATAVTFQETRMTYGELNAKAHALAAQILEKTEGRNEVVGLCVSRSQMIIGLLAILKAGCAYLPIDPNYPVRRVDYMLKDADIKVLVTQKAFALLFEKSSTEQLLLDNIDTVEVVPQVEMPVPKKDHLAYVIYTSGSTGRPKGVPITHDNILNSTAGRLDYYPENPKAFLLLSSISFDSSKAGIFWTLCTGGNLIVGEDRIEQDMLKMADTIQQNRVTHTLLLPTLYQLMLEHLETAKLQSLTTVMVAGEACSVSLADRHYATLPDTELYNEYGPTEATVWCIAHKIIQKDSAIHVPLGRPVANSEIYLLDTDMNLVPFGVTGEIYIGGSGLARGYLNRSDLTAKAFVDNPFSDLSSDKLYKTGDLARYNSDGEIEFLGRSDQQIKIRGYRIELEEIAKAIRAVLETDQVIVLAEGDAGAPKRIAAYLVATEPIAIAELRKSLKHTLPDYMVPAKIIKVDSFPLLPNGKIDKMTLGQLTEFPKEVHSERNQKSTNETEAKLVKIWQEVLNFTPIGIHDNFFEIGGDSISSIQIIAKARKAGIALKPNQLFDHQTIAELSLFATNESIRIFSVENLEGDVPLTPIQHWFFDVHSAAPHFWNQIIRISKANDVPYSKIKEIIETLVSHHDALRLSFRKSRNIWKAKILSPESVQCVHYIDVGDKKEIHLQDQHIRETIATNQENCDLEKGNLFRALYFECGGLQENKIFLIAHHLVTDIVSWNIIFSAISLSMGKEKKSVFNQKTASVKAWGLYLAGLVKSPEIQAEFEFWKSQKNDVNSLPADFDNTHSVFEERFIAIYQSVLTKDDTSVLLHRANEAFHTKIEDLLITELLTVLCQWGSLDTFCLGLERHGRNAELITVDVSDTVGWFTSFFPITLNYLKTGNIGERIKSVKEQLRAIPNNGIGYGVLKYLSVTADHRKSLNQTPQLIFNYLGVQNKTFESSKVLFEQLFEGVRDPLSERNYGLELNVLVVDDQLHMNWSYSTALYTERTVKHLVQKFENNLQDLVTYCLEQENEGYTPSDFPEAGLSQDDLDNLLRSFE